jgi:hypothetical protein
VQVAAGAFAPTAYHDFIGFEVAKPLLERTFEKIYGLEMKDVFVDEDLAIGTYRFAVSQAIPNATKVAWRDKREEIEKVTPGINVQIFQLQAADAGGRTAVPAKLQGRARSLSAVARGACRGTAASAEHELRHRTADPPRRVLARRRD